MAGWMLLSLTGVLLLLCSGPQEEAMRRIGSHPLIAFEFLEEDSMRLREYTGRHASFSKPS